MIVCPECGFPMGVSNEGIVAEKTMKCRQCEWEGSSRELILVPANTDDERFYEKLVELYQWTARVIGPKLGKKLCDLGLVYPPKTADPSKMDSEDKAMLRFLAVVLQGATRGAFEGMIKVLTKEVGADEGSRSRGTVH